AQGMSSRAGIDTAGRPSQPISRLNATLTHRPGALVHGLAEGEGAVGPTAARGGKEEARVLMRAPPLAQLLHHGRSQRNVTVFAPFAILDVEAGRIFAAMNVFELDAHGFTDSQAALIHQRQTSAESGFAYRSQNKLDFRAGKHNRQDLGVGDP